MRAVVEVTRVVDFLGVDSVSPGASVMTKSMGVMSFSHTVREFRPTVYEFVRGGTIVIVVPRDESHAFGQA